MDNNRSEYIQIPLRLKPDERAKLETLASEQTRDNMTALLVRLINAEWARRDRRLKRQTKGQGNE